MPRLQRPSFTLTPAARQCQTAFKYEKEPKHLDFDVQHSRLRGWIICRDLLSFDEIGCLEDCHPTIGQNTGEATRFFHERTAQHRECQTK